MVSAKRSSAAYGNHLSEKRKCIIAAAAASAKQYHGAAQKNRRRRINKEMYAIISSEMCGMAGGNEKWRPKYKRSGMRWRKENQSINNRKEMAASISSARETS